MSYPQRLWLFLRDELRPFEGRAAATWRVAAICALAAMVFMIYEIPLVAIGCYLIIFLMRANLSESLLMALGICILVSFVIPILFFLTNISINVPILRMVIIALVSFLFLFIGASTPLGEIGGIIALVIAFVMSLLGMIPIGEIATRAILYAWLMVLIPMGVLILFLAVTAPSPLHIVRKAMAQRYRLVAAVLRAEEGAQTRVREALDQGNDALSKHMVLVKLFYLSDKAEHLRLQQALDSSWQLLLAASVYHPQQATPAPDPTLLMRLESVAQAYESGAEPDEVGVHGFVNTTQGLALRRIATIAAVVPRRLAVTETAPKSGFFAADTLTNPAYQYYALKTTCAAIFCYITYTALQWQGIHTAMITCYVVALSTSGETVHKLVLRICGCLIGASLGAFVVLVFMPYMTSIGHLMLVVFVGILCAGWVSTGSERISYAGVQIGLAFLMTVLQGFGPDLSLDVARDRIVGILLGNTVMFVMFTYVWPLSTLQSTSSTMHDVVAFVRQRALKQPEDLQGLAPYVLAKLKTVREKLDYIYYEPVRLRASQANIAEYIALPSQLEQAYLQAAFPASQESDEQRAARLNRALDNIEQALVQAPST